MNIIRKSPWLVSLCAALVLAGLLSSCRRDGGSATTSGGGKSNQSVVTLEGAAS